MTRDEILTALKAVMDPELKRDIVALGMVRDVQFEGSKVFVQLEVTSPSATFRESLKKAVRDSLMSLKGVEDVTVQFAAATKAGTPFAAKFPIPGIKHIIAVASGKGGVGKTTASVNLALAFKNLGYRVGLMDGDIYGPNVPLMLGVSADARPQVSSENKLIPLEAYGIKMISMGVLVPADQPMVWRGPMLHSAVTQFLQKVDWGELDFLFVDLPPGTGDVQLSLVQTVPLTGAVIVTTPQEVALMDVRKGVLMFRKTEVPILGVVENMSGEIFGKGGGEKAAAQFEVPFLGSVPLDPQVRIGGDAGKPVTAVDPDLEVSRAFRHAADLLAGKLRKAEVPS
ncbi:MAG TPA: Mrp/NBP35 family ATP-binding protein [Verrucomicrobiae bacterium]|nr:Mrp/NBP35 family ATP-binding protein [Verrucomicrobiae bacterium]